MKIGIGIGVDILKNAGGFSSEYQTVYDAMTNKPTAAISAAQDTMVKAWVASGVWAEMDILYVFAQYSNDDGEAQINWKNPGTKDVSLVNAPTFTSLEGFTGVAASETSINTGWDPTNDGSKFVLQDASISIYVRNNLSEDTYTYGFESSSASRCLFRPRNTSNAINSYINANALLIGSSIADCRGMHITNRNGDGSQLYFNKTEKDTDGTAGSQVGNEDICILAWNDEGTIRSWCNYQVSMFAAGGALSSAQRTSMTDDFETYMDSNSKGVIT